MKIKAIYKDAKGSITGFLDWDEQKFVLLLEDGKYLSEDLTSFQRCNGGAKQRIEVDGFNRLVNCELQISFPIIIEINGEINSTTLKSTMNIGHKNDKSHRITSQVLEIDNTKVESDELAIMDINKLESLLPPGVKLKGCFNCAFAGSGVYGNSFFGRLLCFRKMKTEFLKVVNKEDFMDLMDEAEFPVNQLFLCNDYQRRTNKSWV